MARYPFKHCNILDGIIAMEFYQLKHLIAVIETGGFTKGAERVAVSQPAISSSIAKLEAELNVRLVERRPGGVVPTAAGARLLEAGRSILQACQDIKAEVVAIANRTTLRIGVMSPLGSEGIADLLTAYQQAHPEIEIELIDGHCDGWCHCDNLFSPLGDGERDAVLSILNDRVTSRFAAQALFRLPYQLAVKFDHPFAARAQVSVEDLAGEPLILPERCAFLSDVTQALGRLGGRLRAVYRTDHDDRALALVASGLGLSLIAGRFDVAGVKLVPVSDLGLFRTIGLVWPHERFNPAIQNLIEFAKGHAKVSRGIHETMGSDGLL